MTTTMMMNGSKELEEFENLFALGGQYLCHDDDGMMIPPTTVYGNGYGIPMVGNRRQQQPCVSAAEKKRQDRNAREKERSFRITKQIDELKELLMNSGITIKKQSKYAILSGAATYLQELQKKSQQLTTDLGNIGQDPLHTDRVTNHSRLPCNHDAITKDRERHLQKEQTAENERLSFFLKGEDAALHAKKTFYSAPIPLAIVGIDGNILEVNTMFVKLTRMSADDLQRISLFKLIQPSCLHDCCSKIANMVSPGKTNMDDTMLCHANKINDLFGRPTGRAGCSQISMPRDRLLVRSIVPCGGFVDTIERINACSFVNTIPTYHIPTPIHPIPTRMMIHDISQEKKLNHQDRNNNPFHRQRSSLSPLPSLLSPPSSPTTIANGLFNMCDRMTDSTSMDSLLSIAAPIPNHKLIGGDSHQEDSRRESPKPLKKRPVNQHTDTAECSQSTDVEEHSSSDGNGTMSAQGKKRSHQNMSTTIDSMHGELGYFNLTLVRNVNMEPRYFSVAFITAEEIPYD